MIGDFNGWTPAEHELLMPHRNSGIWEGFIAGVGKGERYKYQVVSNNRGYTVRKGDPFAFKWEVPPKTASIVWESNFRWDDEEWMEGRKERISLSSAISVYEVHLGSWRRVPEDGNRSLRYREAAPLLADYAVDKGFTHVEFLPLMEHPFYGSWGYQTTGYFAPTSRYGDPEDLACLVDHLHKRGVGVIFDWVPSHFPNDQHGLGYFDGTHLFEHDDPRRGVHPEWNSLIFNYGRHEVNSFLISNAMFWLGEFHVDALRVDAVASMLYLDYGRKEGEWIPNERGGHENLEALSFLRNLNEAVYASFPGVQMIAEESTAWPMVSRPTDVGGLGFGYKWDMGWMHDTLAYISRDSVHRKYHHDQLTFSLWYAFSENYILPLSHDEVVYGKGSLLRKMPGDDWQKFANLRLLLGYMYSHPGKKLLFMGGEIGQWDEWNHDRSLDWHLLDYEPHAGIQRLVRDLNRVLRKESAFHELDSSPEGFEWINFNDWEQSVIVFVRKAKDGEKVLCAFNFTPVPREGYWVGVPEPGLWRETLNTDAKEYGGSGMGNSGAVMAGSRGLHGKPYSLELVLPPLACVYLTNPRD